MNKNTHHSQRNVKNVKLMLNKHLFFFKLLCSVFVSISTYVHCNVLRIHEMAYSFDFLRIAIHHGNTEKNADGSDSGSRGNAICVWCRCASMFMHEKE